MSKILIFNSFYHPNIVGGAERSVQMIAESLVEDGDQVSIISTSDKDQSSIVNGVKVYYVNIPNLYWVYHSKKKNFLQKLFWHALDSSNFLIGPKIHNIIRDEKPDIIHTNNLTGFSPFIFKIAKSLNIPIIHTIRDYYFLCSRSSMFRAGENCINQCFSCKLFSLPKKRLSSHVDAVVGVSDFILQKHLENGFFKQAKVQTRIFNIFKPPFNNPIKKVQARGKLRFGYIGVMAPTKGTEYTLRSFSGIGPSKASLNVYGKGQTQEYEKYLTDTYASNNVNFWGFMEPHEIYYNIDVLIIPSLWHEPFPRTLIEAFSFGIPVIASNRGGIPEFIKDGENGLIYDPAVEDSLFNLIIRVLNNPEILGRIKLNALKCASEFKKETILKQYRDVYRAILN